MLDVRTGEAIGMSRFHGYDPGRSEVEVGWTFLARPYWGGVYNRELKELMLGHAFRWVANVVFLIAPGNMHSRRAVEKLGAIEIGTRADGAGRPSVVYRIHAPETAARMHADEVETDASLVRRLLAAQFPQWAGLPIERVLPAGTDNAIYRVGDGISVRLPASSGRPMRWRRSASGCRGLRPSCRFPFPCRSREESRARAIRGAGRCAGGSRVRARPRSASPIRARPRWTWPGSCPHCSGSTRPVGPGPAGTTRSAAWRSRHATVRPAPRSPRLGSAVDADAASAAWDEALAAPEWDSPPTWIHGDLDSRNMLAAKGRLSAVLDFGCLGVGDPAYDVMVAWKLLAADARDRFRTALAVDDATWARARGLALSQALIALGYYTMETNPVLVLEARRWLAEVLADRFRDP